jgi:tetratricopeptide (TPR) repeat protein
MKYCLLLLFFSLNLFSQAQVAEVSAARNAMAEEDFSKAADLAAQAMPRYSKTSAEYRSLIDVFLESKINLGELDEALRVNNEYLDLLTKTYGKEDTSLVTFFSTQGTIHYLNGYYNEAVASSEQGIVIVQKKGLTNDRLYAELQNNVGMLYSLVGETAKALSAFDMSRAYFEKTADQHTY